MSDEPLTADDIPWRTTPLPVSGLTPADPATPDERGLLYAEIAALETQVDALTQDTGTLRDLLSDALTRLQALSGVCDRYQTRIGVLVTEIAAQNRELRTLRAQVRAQEEVPFG